VRELLLMLSMLLASCSGLNVDNNITKSLVADVENPIYIEEIRLFLPVIESDVGLIVYEIDNLRPHKDSIGESTSGVWILSRDSDYRRISFSYREKVEDKYVRGKISGSVSVSINSLLERKERLKGWRHPDVYSLQDTYREIKAKLDKENSKRREVLSKTVEEHWNHKFATETVEEMGEGVLLHYEGVAQKFNDVYTTYEARLKDHRESFYYHKGRERARYVGLLDNTVEIVELDGVECIQSDRYERLTTPIINPSKTAGGIEHKRSYICYFGADLEVFISSRFKIAPGYDLDFDAMLYPMLNGLRWPADYKVIYDIHSRESAWN